jgi:phosphatidylglycerol:prolipoprotein diacylglycerol transferase
MINIIPNPILLDLGIIRIHYYGLIFVIAVLVSMFIIEKITKKQGSYNKNHIENLYLYLLVFGIIGARLYSVFFFDWNYYRYNLLDIVKIWNGGIAIQGAVISGIITLSIYCKKNKLDFLKYVDLFALVMPLAQAIGRWGNFFNGELYGRISELPWAIYIASTDNYHQPVFLYESILNIILFVVLFRFLSRGYFKGKIISYYIIGYGIVRFLMEFIRIDIVPQIMGLRLPMITSVFWLIIGIISLILLTKKYKSGIIT